MSLPGQADDRTCWRCLHFGRTRDDAVLRCTNPKSKYYSPKPHVERHTRRSGDPCDKWTPRASFGYVAPRGCTEGKPGEL